MLIILEKVRITFYKKPENFIEISSRVLWKEGFLKKKENVLFNNLFLEYDRKFLKSKLIFYFFSGNSLLDWTVASDSTFSGFLPEESKEVENFRKFWGNSVDSVLFKNKFVEIIRSVDTFRISSSFDNILDVSRKQNKDLSTIEQWPKGFLNLWFNSFNVLWQNPISFKDLGIHERAETLKKGWLVLEENLDFPQKADEFIKLLENKERIPLDKKSGNRRGLVEFNLRNVVKCGLENIKTSRSFNLWYSWSGHGIKFFLEHYYQNKYHKNRRHPELSWGYLAFNDFFWWCYYWSFLERVDINANIVFKKKKEGFIYNLLALIEKDPAKYNFAGRLTVYCGFSEDLIQKKLEHNPNVLQLLKKDRKWSSDSQNEHIVMNSSGEIEGYSKHIFNLAIKNGESAISFKTFIYGVNEGLIPQPTGFYITIDPEFGHSIISSTWANKKSVVIYIYNKTHQSNTDLRYKEGSSGKAKFLKEIPQSYRVELRLGYENILEFCAKKKIKTNDRRSFDFNFLADKIFNEFYPGLNLLLKEGLEQLQENDQKD